MFVAPLFEHQIVAYPLPDNGRSEGFGDIVHCTQGESDALVFFAGEGRDEDNRDCPKELVGLHGPEELVPVHVRHPDIQQDQVWLNSGGKLQSLLS